MTHAGWFHRTGRGPERLQWVPADTTSAKAGTATTTAHRSGFPNGDVAPTGPSPVSEVNGRVPATLEDFLGVTSFTGIRGDLAYRVFGTGEPGAGLIRFRQQDLGRDGRTTRTWTITVTRDRGGITAEPDTAG